MKLATLRSNEVAIIKNDTVILLGDVLGKGSTMLDLIAQYDAIRARLGDAARSMSARCSKPT